MLLDSSVWIDYLRAEPTPARAEVRRLVGQGASLATTEPVAMELLAGAVDERALAMIERLVAGMVQLRVQPALDYIAAAHIFRLARRRGRAVRKLNDCLIAAVAIRTQTHLVHKDADFEAIATCVALAQTSLR